MTINTAGIRAAAAEAGLTKAQAAALRELGEPYHYRVNWRPKLSDRQYRDLLKRELIAEVWTWASTTRPDTCITEAGRRALLTPSEPTP